MAKNQGQIKFGVGFNVDKSGLNSAFNDLRQQLQSLQNLTISDLGFTKSTKEAKEKLESLKGVAKQVEAALQQSFNKDLGTTNITKFNQVLTSSGTNLKTVVNSLNDMGVAGKKAANTLTAELLTTNKHIRETSKWIDKMAETMSNTVRWSIASSALNSMTGSVQKAYGFTKQLDASLNDIMIVTDKSAEDMARFAKQANTAAKSLGAVTTDYTKASLIYYQQGLSDQEVAARTETTMKVANVTGQGADAVSEQLTAVWNGYKVNSQEAELYIDKLSAVAATTAADLEELSTGMSRVASAANIMGVDIDQLNAQLATIVSVTREAPESIGTALKTVYARMSDIEAGLDTETTLGEYTKQMAEMGINALDANGNLRDMGDVVEEIGDKWTTLNRNQQTALAQTIAGTRQYSRMMALFDNWDMYQAAKGTSQNAAGTLQAQNEEYMESMEAHLNKLQAEAEELYQTLFDADSLKPLISGLTSIVGLIENIIESIGGGQGLIGVLGTIGLNVFGDKLTMGISKGIRNIKGEIDNLNEEKAQANLISQLEQDLAKSGIDTSEMSKDTIEDIVNLKKEQLKVEKYLSEEQKQQANDLIKEKAALENQKIDLEKKVNNAKQVAQNLVKNAGKQSDQDNAAELLREANSTTQYNSLFNNWKEVMDLQAEETKFRNSARGFAASETRALENLMLAQTAGDAERIMTAQQGVNVARKKQREQAYTADFINVEKNEKIDNLFAQMQGASEFKDDIEKLKKSSLFSEDDVKRLKEIEKIINDIYTKRSKGEFLNEEEITDFNNALRDLSKYSQEGKQGLKDAAAALENGEKAAADLEKKLQQLKDTNDKLISSFRVEEVVSSFVNLAGSVRSVGEGITQLQRIGSIWSNDDLTTGEKILQTVSSLSFALPMLITGVSGASKAIKGLSAAHTAFTASLGMSTAITMIDTQIQKAAGDQAKENAFWKTILKKCEDELTDEQIESIAKTLAQNKALDDNTKALLKNIAAKKLANGQEIGDMKVDSKDLWKTFGDKLGGGIKKALTKAAPTLIIGAFVAVAAAAVAGAYSFIDNWHKKEQKALAETKKLAQEAAESTQLLKESYDQLSSSVDKYTEITASIDDMVAGTREYKDAIHDANDELLAMIRQYPELSSQIEESTEHAGLLVLKTEDALENLLKLESNKVSQAQAVEYGLQAQTLQAEQDLAISQQARKIKTGGQTMSEVGYGMTNSISLGTAGAMGGLALGTSIAGASFIGATAGSVIPVVGTIVGAIVGLAAGAVATVASASESIQSNNEDLITRTAKLYNENNALFSGTKDEVKKMLSEKLDLKDDALLDSLYENQKAIKDLSANIKSLNLAEDQYRTQQAEQYLSSIGINHQYQTNVAKELKLSEEDTAKYLEQANQMTDAQIHEYWASKNNRTYIKNKAGKGAFSYIDANGNIQKEDIDDKILRTQVAEMLALEQEIGVQAHDIIDAIDAVANTGVKAVNDQLANVVTQEELNLKSLTVAERKMFEAALENLKMISIGTLNEMGVDSVNVLNSYAQESLRSLDEYLNKLATKYISNDGRREQYNNLFTDGGVFADSDLSVANREILAQLYGDLDTLSLNALTNIFSILGEEAEDFIALLPSLSAEGINAFKENLVLDTAFAELLLDPVFKTFITGVQDAFHLYEQFNKEEHQSNIAFLQDIASKLHNIGDEISSEDYTRLPAELKTFFTETETGMYSLISRAHEFKAAVKETEQEKLIAQIRDTQAQIEREETKLKNGSLMSTQEASQINNMIAAARKVDYHGQSLVDAIYQEEGNVQYYHNVMDAMTKAEEMLGFLSTHPWAGQTSGNAVDMLRDADYAVDYWYQQIQKGYTGFSKDMILDLAVLMDQYIAGYENKLPDETEGDVQNNIENLNAQFQAQQEQAAAQAGSLFAFENLVQKGLITDESIIDKYTDFYTNVIPQKFAASVDYSFQLKDSEKAIESLTKKLQKYEDAYDSVFGDNKIKMLKAQSSTLKDLNNQYLEQIEILQAQAEFYKNNTLSNSLATAGLTLGDLRFDKNGQIMNYGSISQQAADYFRTIGNGEEPFKNFINALNNYVAYIDQIEGNLELITENKIKEFDIKLNIKLDKNNTIREWNNFIKEWKGTKIETEVIPIAPDNNDDSWNYWAEQAQKNLNTFFDSNDGDLAILYDELADIENRDYDYAKKEEEKGKKLQQIENKLLESKQYLLELEESHISALNEINSIYQEQIDYLDNIYNYYKQNLELSKLLNGENKNWINESNYYTKAKDAKITEEEIARRQLIDNQERLQSFINKAKTEEEYSTEEFRTLTTNFQESLSNWQSSISEAIEAVKEEYLATIDNIFYRFEQKLTNGKGLEVIKDEFDWTKDMRDKYLDNVNREFGISSFARNVDKEINVNTSIKAQQDLNKLREDELETLRSKDKLTQYDLDRANKRLDILKAQIALEDAQQDKSQMRLVRGADGSYGYQYVADANKIAEAEETLAKAQNELYNMDVDEYEANLDRMFQLYEEYRERMIELANDEDGLTEEDIVSLQKYVDEIQRVAKASNSISENLGQETELLGSEIAMMSKLINENGFANLFSEFKEEITGEEGFTKIFINSLGAIKTSWSELEGTVTTFLENPLGDNNEASLNDLLGIDWEARKTEAENYVANVANVIAQGWKDAEKAVSDYQIAVENATSKKQGEVLVTGPTGVTISMITSGGVNNWKGGSSTLPTDSNNTENNNSNNVNMPNQINQGLATVVIKVGSYDTGGYTGEWGPEGRIALLHEKELVLKPDDTTNILSAVETMRGISNALNNDMFTQLLDKLSASASAMVAQETARDMLIEQDVHIEAVFPNVNVAEEIEAAFNDIIDMAAQRVTKNTRG